MPIQQSVIRCAGLASHDAVTSRRTIPVVVRRQRAIVSRPQHTHATHATPTPARRDHVAPSVRQLRPMERASETRSTRSSIAHTTTRSVQWLTATARTPEADHTGPSGFSTQETVFSKPQSTLTLTIHNTPTVTRLRESSSTSLLAPELQTAMASKSATPFLRLTATCHCLLEETLQNGPPKTDQRGRSQALRVTRSHAPSQGALTRSRHDNRPGQGSREGSTKRA